MAHRYDRQSVARPVRTRFEPSHLAQACLEDAYLRLVPVRRRTRPPLPGREVLAAAEGSRWASSLRRPPKEEAQRCS